MYSPPRAAGRARPAGPQLAVPGRLVGVRIWDLGLDSAGSLRLGSPQSGRRWRADGETTWAQCFSGRRGVRHPEGALTPAGNCTCGLYLLHPCAAEDSDFWRPTWLEGSLQVVGLAEAWGRVHVHAEGFRAQYARPIAFALSGRERGSDYGRIVDDLAIGHRAQVLELESARALLEHCLRQGLGMQPDAIRELLTQRKPGSVRVDRPPSA